MKNLNLKSLKEQGLSTSEKKGITGGGGLGCYPHYYCGPHYCANVNPMACCCPD